MVEFASFNHGPKEAPMTEANMPLIELLQMHDEGDFLRAVTEAVLQALMERDVEGMIGAGRYERVNRVPISHEAVALMRLRGDAVPKGCPFLFPGDVPGQPVVDLKRFWEQVRVQVEIPDVRIYDLRHTFASLLISGGASLEMIGQLLGHTQIGTTQRYAHLIDSPLRAGGNAVGEMLKLRLKVVGAAG
jgi:site-specific recombinase XerD